MISMGMRDNNGIHLFHAVLPEILRHPRTMLHISRINKRKLSISFNKDGVSLSDIKHADNQRRIGSRFTSAPAAKDIKPAARPCKDTKADKEAKEILYKALHPSMTFLRAKGIMRATSPAVYPTGIFSASRSPASP